MKEKWLHTFTIDKVQKVKKTETEKDESGKDIEVTREEEEKTPQTFKILNPNRKIQDDSSIFYSVKVSEGIKLGLITKAYLMRKFQQDGLLASDEEKKQYTENYSRAIVLEIELEKLKNDDSLNEAEKKLKQENMEQEYVKLKEKIFEYENVQNSLFDNTAEKRASDLLSIWFLLHLLHFGEDGKEVCVFGAGSFDERIEKLNEIEDSENEFLISAVEKGAFYIGQLNAGVKKEELVD